MLYTCLFFSFNIFTHYKTVTQSWTAAVCIAVGLGFVLLHELARMLEREVDQIDPDSIQKTTQGYYTSHLDPLLLQPCAPGSLLQLQARSPSLLLTTRGRSDSIFSIPSMASHITMPSFKSIIDAEQKGNFQNHLTMGHAFHFYPNPPLWSLEKKIQLFLWWSNQ